MGLRRNNRTNRAYSAKSPIGPIACPVGRISLPTSVPHRIGHCHGFRSGFKIQFGYTFEGENGLVEPGIWNVTTGENAKKPPPAFLGGLDIMY
jgi:hypothetical protein